MANKSELMIKEKQVEVFSSSLQTAQWEPFMIEGEQIGEVSILRYSNEVVAGYWRHKPEEHPNGMPYGVPKNETFYVLEGEAIVTATSGETITLKSDNVYSFSTGFEGTWKTIKPFVKFFIEN